MSFLALEDLHVFVTGAAGGIGSAMVAEFLAQGCRVTGHDVKTISSPSVSSHFNALQGDISSESSISGGMAAARAHFGPIHVLCANAGITDETRSPPIWEIPTDTWDRTYAVNVRGTFLTLKHFLLGAQAVQAERGAEMEHLAVVLTGSETGVFGQAGHAEYASGKAGLQYGLVRSVKNEIVKLNRRARINAVAPGWVDTKLIDGRLDDPRELWAEAQATVPLAKIAQPQDVARAAAFLASHRAAGHITGQCLSVDGGMEGRLVWRTDEIAGLTNTTTAAATAAPKSIALPSSATSSIPLAHTVTSPKPTQRIQILLSVDFDAVSGYLGTGQDPANNLSDYSAGFFSARVGVPRLLRLFTRLNIAKRITWFLPGHSIESFPQRAAAIAASGAELGCHGYAHEGAPQLTEKQERDVIAKSVELVSQLAGKPVKGYRAPLYQLRESTIAILEAHGFTYDSSLTAHDSSPYSLPAVPIPPIIAPRFESDVNAHDWMHPLPHALTHGMDGPINATGTSTPQSRVLEIPANWYAEDMTPLQFYPHTANSQGYVPVRGVEAMWRDRLEFLLREVADGDRAGETVVYPLTLHPDTSGMAHVAGMLERVVKWFCELEERGFVEFRTMGECASEWRERFG